MKKRTIEFGDRFWVKISSLGSGVLTQIIHQKGRLTGNKWTNDRGSIHAAALSDPDAQPVTPEELEEFKPVPDAKAIREGMNLTQREFASRFQLSLRTLQDWETST